MERVGQQEIKIPGPIPSKEEKKKEDIAFQQTDCTCHHKKPLLIAEQYTARCVEAPHIRVAEFPWFCLVDAAVC